MDRSIHEDLERLAKANVFANYIGLEVTDYDADCATLSLRVEERHLNPLGFVHGGVYYTMADCAAGVAARTDGRRYVTQSGGLSFFRSGAPGDRLEARAAVRRRGRSTCYMEVDVFDQKGTLLAAGNYTYFRVQEKPDQA